MQYGKVILFVFTVLWGSILSGQRYMEIRGTITDGAVPIKDVRIQIEGKTTQVFSGEDGTYAIKAEIGDLLRYSHIGMRDYIVRVEDATHFINLIMLPVVNELDEVVVTSRGPNRKSQKELRQEYPLNKRLISTAFGILDADTYSGRIQFLNEDRINPIGLCILDLLRARFSGVRVSGNCQSGGSVVLRGGVGSLSLSGSAIFDVDGLIMKDPPIWIDISNIKRIAILFGFASAVKYGSISNGGVVVINTKTGSPTWDGDFDLAQIRGNYVTEPVLDREAVAMNDPIYLKKLTGSQSVEEAKMVYGEFKDSYGSFPHFNLDSYRFFFDMPGASDFADEIIESNISKWEDNASLLKALAYIYSAQNRFEEALQLNKKIMVLRPNYGQSYLDLGMAYADSGKITQAITLFARYKHLVEAGLLETSSDFQDIIQHEIDNILEIYADSLVTDPKRILKDPYSDSGTRLLVAWNDSEAEFHLQFVNPESKVYTWEHTFESNEERILEEKLKGYSVAEYLIDNSLRGEWNVQVKYLGNKSRTPTYMRITVYENFNTSEQRKTTKVFKLLLKDVYQHLLSLNNSWSLPWEER